LVANYINIQLEFKKALVHVKRTIENEICH
jgi:hypothetical protein